MTDFYVTTQGLENYGAHGGTGKFADDQSYWKVKSGTDYIVSGLDRCQDAMAFVASICMYNDIGWKEFPSECIPMDEWEAKWDMSNEHHVEYREFKLKYVQRVDPSTNVRYVRSEMRTTLGAF